MSKKISVVIPTYKRTELLQKCLDALNQQTFDKVDYEIVVVSDGPDQDTKACVAAYNDITYLELPIKKGPAAARNLGWHKAKGIIIAFTDDDCLPDKNWLSTTWASYADEDEIAFTGTVIVPLPEKPTDYERNTANLETAEFITANCACTKKALLKTGGFDERFACAWREDSDLHFKLLSYQIPLRKIDAIVVHPVRKAIWGISLKEQKKGMYNALLYKKYPALYRDRIGSKAPWFYYGIILSVIAFLTGVITQLKIVSIVSLFAWLMLLTMFVLKRLKFTSNSGNHVAEMIYTSAIIPFLSVYWQWYGALKYRVFFI